jgi:hypothetical protein
VCYPLTHAGLDLNSLLVVELRKLRTRVVGVALRIDVVPLIRHLLFEDNQRPSKLKAYSATNHDLRGLREFRTEAIIKILFVWETRDEKRVSPASS